MDLGDLLKNIGIGDVIGDMLQLLHLFLIQGIGDSVRGPVEMLLSTL